MKKIPKRLLTATMTLATLFTSLPVTQVQASSNSVVRLEKHPQYGYQFDNSYPAPFSKSNAYKDWWTFHMNVNGSGTEKLVYCIQYHIPCNTGDRYSHQDTHPDINPAQQKLLQRALVFGYNENTGNLYGGSWLDNAMAIQAMVWVITGGQYGTSWETRIADNLLQDNPTARGIYNQIRSNMESYSTIPSFTAPSASSAKDYEMKYNMNSSKFELALEDGNNALKYFDFSASGVSVQRSVNKLTLSAPTEKQFDTITLKANKNLPKDVLPSLISGTPEFWINPTQQNFASLDVSGSREAVPAYFKLHTEKIGHIQLKKTSEDGNVSGLRFQIIGNGIDRVYTTDTDGNLPIKNLVAGEYIIKEVDTPNKYVQPQTQVVYVKPAETTAVDFSNVLKKFSINITKSDEETGNTSQGDATLDGAEYDIYDSQGNLADHMKADGKTATSKLLVLGTYKIYEVVPPTGYNINNEPITVTGDFEGQNVEIGRADTGITDRVIKGQIAVTKFADKPLTGSSEDGGIKQPLEGIEFTLTLKSTGAEACKIITDADGYAITPLLPYGVYHIEETKGAEGYRKIEPFDIKIDSNGKIYKYILENTVYETDVKIVKKDAETGKVIPLAGTQFKIKDSSGNWVTQKYNYPKPTTIDTFSTAEDGTLVLPQSLPAGNYKLYEVKAPYGYTISKDPIPFTVSASDPSTMLEVASKNKPVKGNVTIEKQGERFVASDNIGTELGVLYSPIYELQKLEGVTFDIVAVEDIKTQDGTIRYKKGETVDTITTGKNGKATPKALYLGKYQAIEISTLNGFVLDGTAHPFELTYKDQDTEIVTTSMTLENARQKASVSLFKEYETVSGQEYNPLSEIKFGLYAREHILTARGDVGIEKGSLIEVISLDELGNGTIHTDLPAGSYTIKEVATGKGYLLTEKAYDFDFNYMGQDVPYIPIHINDGKPILNKLMRGNLEIIKTSEDKKIEGISFKVTGTTEIGTAYEEIFKTDEDGKIVIKDMLIGTYEVSEVVNDLTVGYITPENQTVTVKHDETVQVEMENKLIHGGFKLLKTDEDKKPLAGVKFGLYKADGTQVTEFITGEDGTYRMTDLLYGDYYLKELETVKGYAFDKETVYAFSVSKDGEIVEITAVNNKIPEQPKAPQDTPKTGDTSNLATMLALLGVSAVSLAGIGIMQYRKKKKAQ
ncbi:MAG: SpaA isopeptide-forming pilin-related protein [Lachnospiraceae bacterium]